MPLFDEIDDYHDPMYDHICVVTNRNLVKNRSFINQIDYVCSQKPKMLILREKDMSEKDYLNIAADVEAVCHFYDVIFMPHKFVDVAEKMGVDRIHLSLEDLRNLPRDVRSLFRYIGCSVHNLDEVIEANHLGASYLVAGHIYPTDCKKGLPPKGTSFLKSACVVSDCPVWAIGGIKPDHDQIDEVVECGAAGGCIMSGMMELE